MIYCFDTYYTEDKAITAVIGIEDWHCASSSFELIKVTDNVNEYESGSFYKRELPCIISILETMSVDASKDILVIDGYVVLSDDGKLGLGGYLYKELGESIPVIGVAKNDFFSLHSSKIEVLRGNSKNPLYITALGIDILSASLYIKKMAGTFRIPTILRLVDQIGRTTNLIN